MKRLTTTKKLDPELFKNAKDIDENKYFLKGEKSYKDTIEAVANKLGQLEDIEEELGIDLITLCKTFEEDIYIKPDNKIIFVNYDKKEYRFYEGNINCNTDDGNFTVSIDDYGKTWALTKEELEK